MARGVPNQAYRVRSRLIVKRVLARSERKGWDADKTAAVIVVSLSPARVKAGVVGPCFYCGDDFAATVDHIHPLAEGGADDRVNVLSACFRCNILKHTLPLDRFLSIYPFGADLQRAYRLRNAPRTDEYERLAELRHQWHIERSKLLPTPGPGEPWGMPPTIDDRGVLH